MQPTISVSQFVQVINDTLEMTYPSVDIVGEVSGYKVWDNRLVFFDLKDDEAAINCMIPLGQLETPLEDGMQVCIAASPKVTKKGRFSVTVRSLQLVGEGALRRAFELLKAKLDQEGLFSVERKRILPRFPARIGVITSLDSAAYHDFLKTLKQRWEGVEVVAVHSQVQGEAAPEQLVSAITYVNQLSSPADVLVITRGGGSLEDLAAFNSETVVRAVASSRVPTVVAVGHETDTSLADLAADMRATTPTDAVRHIVPDKREIEEQIARDKESIRQSIRRSLQEKRSLISSNLYTLSHTPVISRHKERVGHDKQLLIRQQSQLLRAKREHLTGLKRTLSGYNPDAVLKRGYAIVRHDNAVLRRLGGISVGDMVVVQLSQGSLEAEVTNVHQEN